MVLPGISWKYLLILIKAGHRRKTNGYQDLHSDQSETDYRFEVLSKGNCGQSSCAAKHRPTDQKGFGKKQGATAASCQLHIGLISSNQLNSAQMETSAAPVFTDAWQPPLLLRLLHSKNPPLLLPQHNRNRKLFELKAINWSWTVLSPAYSPHARNDYQET